MKIKYIITSIKIVNSLVKSNEILYLETAFPGKGGDKSVITNPNNYNITKSYKQKYNFKYIFLSAIPILNF